MNQYTVYHLIQFFWAIMESKINRWVYVLIQKFQSGFWHIYWINSGTTENFEIKEDFFCIHYKFSKWQWKTKPNLAILLHLLELLVSSFTLCDYSNALIIAMAATFFFTKSLFLSYLFWVTWIICQVSYKSSSSTQNLIYNSAKL